ncbi:MAG: hypothetical protein A2418_03060 [Candidatus Brennerbacteria bacterium RIFOXYC1_FULL_41_11]|uniref:Uncharacterized protein n=1 Tax=Candidatus Brennerbacteria bacterium RIFOXYD1_FULL_41_16 TaxID=1797529 RepID=A0A1G1XKM4_9BACT|nr:MAG: hypothetical protein A2391_00665 [Candidatus Brennerbacteria bacterium RIFOXYB1_FULL_41_13]OGY39813.1 MAG: hypothetical protein A2418_03060 [Candidatus Brennerbacteria bacterium RIFOXYC1_FULL_41_11]OGY40589.1 MAG: hypothetical protein A2570_02540 [Candidatus Brennerbacteria bacterium RIFOXYD1_FULL_41_16]
MFKDYWTMTDSQLEGLARRYNLQHFLEEALVSRDDGPLFVINRKKIIDQLSQRDNRNISFWSAVVSVVAAIVSLASVFL